MTPPLKSISGHLRRLIRSCRAGEGDSLLVEGERLVATAISLSPQPPSHLISSCPHLLARLRGRLARGPVATDAALVTPSLMSGLADAATPQACLAVFQRPDGASLAKLRERRLLARRPRLLDYSLICWEVADPANVGAIARLAWCLGARRLLLTPGCANPWAPKVVRAGAGAHFVLPIVTEARFEDAAALTSTFGHVLATWPTSGGGGGSRVRALDCSDRGLSERLPQLTAGGSLCLLLGSEARGLPAELMKGLAEAGPEAATLLHVPMSEAAADVADDGAAAAATLNVAAAAGIVLHRLFGLQSMARSETTAAAGAARESGWE